MAKGVQKERAGKRFDTLDQLVHLEGAERTAAHGFDRVLRARYRRKAEPAEFNHISTAAIRWLRSGVGLCSAVSGRESVVPRDEDLIDWTAWRPVCLGRFRRVMSPESKTGTGFSTRR
jgi:hypothetical protein